METTRKGNQMKTRKPLAALTAIILAASLSACDISPSSSGGTMSSYQVKLSNGKRVSCITNGNGVSCDWEHAE